MLFWIFVIALLVGIAFLACEKLLYHKVNNTDWLGAIGWIIVVVAVVAIVISGVVMIDAYGNAEAMAAKNNKRYESLVYQLENNLYDNDNDVGKKELYNQIREWNEDLAYYQNIQDNFWFGIFHPNVYDQFKFIELGK